MKHIKTRITIDTTIETTEGHVYRSLFSEDLSEVTTLVQRRDIDTVMDDAGNILDLVPRPNSTILKIEGKCLDKPLADCPKSQMWIDGVEVKDGKMPVWESH